MREQTRRYPEMALLGYRHVCSREEPLEESARNQA